MWLDKPDQPGYWWYKYGTMFLEIAKVDNDLETVQFIGSTYYGRISSELDGCQWERCEHS